MNVYIFGKLEYAGLNGDGNIHLIVSKERKDLVIDLCKDLTQLKGKEITLQVKEVAQISIN